MGKKFQCKNVEKEYSVIAMIKGVNRRVVEITSTDNEYFEKAVLYVKADKRDVPAARLEEEAREYMGRIAPRRNPEPVPLALKLGAAAASAVALTLLIYLLICL